MKIKLKVALLVQLSLLALPACWSVAPDDAGDEAFVAWAIPAILGRRAWSQHEVAALAKLADTAGREAVVDALMEEPEFADYWGRVLLEDLRVGSGADKPADTTCFTEEKLATQYDDDLVYHLTYKAWSTEFCPPNSPTVSRNLVVPGATSLLPEWDALASAGPEGIVGRLEALSRTSSRTTAGAAAPVERGGEEYLTTGIDGRVAPASGVTPGRNDIVTPSCESFTMADALRAALSQDRLDVLYRVGLVPMSVSHSQAGATAQFLDAWLSRDPGCVSCHTSLFSTTDGAPRNGDWDRFHTANWVDLEGTVFTYSDATGEHYGGAGGDKVYDNIQGFFRNDAYLSANGKNPFGIDSACTTGSGRRGFRTAITSDADQRTGFSGINGNSYGPLKLIDEFALGVNALYDPDLADPPIWVGADPGPEAALVGCNGCHFPGNVVQAPEDLYEHTKYMAPWRIEEIVRYGSPAGLMTDDYYNPASLPGTVAHLTNPANGHESPRLYANRSAGFAHLVAMTIANNVFQEMAGYSLTIEHDFPRNADATQALEELTRELVDNRWSLKAVVRRIALSDLANRRAPAESSTDPYELPMVVDPWTDVPGLQADTLTGDDRNGQGQLVHRFSVQSLLSQVHHALQWPEPPMLASSTTSTYIDRTFLEEVGAYTDLDHPGFGEVVLPAMLAWEDEIGSCVRPLAVSEDYVDLLTDPATDLTLEQAMLAVKGRLLTYSDWWTGEETLAASLTSLDLDDPASDDPQAVRSYCAALLQSPQFLLAGLPPWEDGVSPPDPDSDVPCVDDRCTWTDHCEHYRDIALDLGYDDASCAIGGFTTR